MSSPVAPKPPFAENNPIVTQPGLKRCKKSYKDLPRLEKTVEKFSVNLLSGFKI